MAATASQRAAMDKAVGDVRRQYERALARAKKSRADAAGYTGFLVTDAEKSVAKQIEDLGPQIQTWATTRRRDAENGRRSDGSTYTVQRFLDLGKDYGSAAALFTQESFNASWSYVVESTTRATKESVEEVVNPLKWPAWAKALAVLVGVAAAAVALAKGRAVVQVLKGG